MVGRGSPLLADSSLRPTSPPASAIRSSRSKARSSDWTPPPLDLAESVVLALDVGTARSFRDWRESLKPTRQSVDSPVVRSYVLLAGILIPPCGNVQSRRGRRTLKKCALDGSEPGVKTPSTER